MGQVRFERNDQGALNNCAEIKQHTIEKPTQAKQNIFPHRTQASSQSKAQMFPMPQEFAFPAPAPNAELENLHLNPIKVLLYLKSRRRNRNPFVMLQTVDLWKWWRSRPRRMKDVRVSLR